MDIDLSRSIELSFRKALDRADRLRESGRGAEAAVVYREAARMSRQLAQYAVGAAEKSRRTKRAADLESLAEKVASLKAPEAAAPTAALPDDADELQSQIDAMVVRADVAWDQIGGLETTKRQIQLAFGIAVAKKPEGVTVDAPPNMLLYGPPGTGKSLLAAAVSNGLKATFFSVSASGVLSKWFGESSRLISALYVTARRRAPSVVFMDELEALFPSRDSATTGAERRVLSTLLAELSGMATSGHAATVLTIGATNAPWLMDTAALSRFGRRVYVPLPDGKARRDVLEIHLGRRGIRQEFPIERLIDATEGLSGRQLAYLASAAVQGMLSDANPGLADLVARRDPAMENYRLKTRPLVWSDVEPVLKELRPDSPPEAIRRFETW
jgi:SpoVK/Ycf46/Vps4 family AAA+-type ATPase